MSTFQDKDRAQDRDRAQVIRHVADVLEQEFPTSPLRSVEMTLANARTERIIRRVRADRKSVV